MDWVAEQRDSIREGSSNMDEVLRKLIAEHTRQLNESPRSLDEKLPPIAFSPLRPACFAYIHLVRTLVQDRMPLRNGDGLDFSHAVMGTAFAHRATLDK